MLKLLSILVILAGGTEKLILTNYISVPLFISGEIFIQIYKIRVGKTDMMNRDTDKGQ